MLTEFELRRRVDEIQLSDSTPMQRVRMLLAICRVLKRQATVISDTRDLSARTLDTNSRSHFERILRSHRMQHDDVRLAAWNYLLAMRSAAVPAQGG